MAPAEQRIGQRVEDLQGPPGAQDDQARTRPGKAGRTADGAFRLESITKPPRPPARPGTCRPAARPGPELRVGDRAGRRAATGRAIWSSRSSTRSSPRAGAAGSGAARAGLRSRGRGRVGRPGRVRVNTHRAAGPCGFREGRLLGRRPSVVRQTSSASAPSDVWRLDQVDHPRPRPSVPRCSPGSGHRSERADGRPAVGHPRKGPPGPQAVGQVGGVLEGLGSAGGRCRASSG